MTTLPHHRCGRACWGMLHLWLSRRRGLLYAGPPEAWNVLYTPREAVRCMLVLFIVVCISSPPFSLPHAPCIHPLLTSPPHIDSPFLPPPPPPPKKKKCYIFVDNLRWTANLNTWIRVPGILINSYTVYLAILYGNHVSPLWAAWLHVFLPPYNALYYNKQAIGNFAV